MKKNPFLTIVLLAVFASSASAAQVQPPAEPVVLPTCVVNAPRLQLAEQRVNASLNALRAKARASVITSLDLPALKTQVAFSSREMAAVRLERS